MRKANTIRRVCQVKCVSFLSAVSMTAGFVCSFNNSHTLEFVPAFYHPLKAGFSPLTSLELGGRSIFYTIPQSAGKALS